MVKENKLINLDLYFCGFWILDFGRGSIADYVTMINFKSGKKYRV